MISVKCLPLGELEANCYYVTDRETAVLIDVGFYDDGLEMLLSSLEVKPTAVLLTHGHFDHICGAIELCNRYNLKIYIGEADKDCLYSSRKNLSAMVGGYTRQPLNSATEVTGLNGGEELKIGSLRLKAISLSGHTAGGMGYLLSDMLFCGDTVFCGSVGRTDLPTGDFNALKGSIKKICELPNETVLYSGHGVNSTVGAEKEHNPYFRNL